jgi:hypothetical protein
LQINSRANGLKISLFSNRKEKRDVTTHGRRKNEWENCLGSNQSRKADFRLRQIMIRKTSPYDALLIFKQAAQ